MINKPGKSKRFNFRSDLLASETALGYPKERVSQHYAADTPNYTLT